MILNTIVKGSSAPVAVEEKDVNFWDYDGTIVASYTAEEFADLSSLPDNPTHDGLTAQGWNWTLADAQSYVANYGMLDVGQMYITDDGKTRLYLEVKDLFRASSSIYMYFTQTVANGVTVDWGDGSPTETYANTGNAFLGHTYTSVGNYVLTLDPLENCTIGFGNYNGHFLFVSAVDAGSAGLLKKLEIGKNVTQIYRLDKLYCLEEITIPNTVTLIQHLDNNYNLKHLNLPMSLTEIQGNGVKNNYNMRHLSLNYGLVTIGSSAFAESRTLERVCIPTSCTTIAGICFGYGVKIKTAVLPDSVQSVGDDVFSSCSCLKYCYIGASISTLSKSMFSQCELIPSIRIPSSVTYISQNAFDSCRTLSLIDCRDAVSVPTLQSTNAFTNLPSDYKIVVPDALYDTWIATSNWSNSSVVGHIVRASEYSD